MAINPLSYYQALLTSEYQSAPNLKAFLTALLTPADDLNSCLAGMNAAFDLDAAVGSQLDVLGKIVGVSRMLPYSPGGGQILTVSINSPGAGYTNGDVLNVVQGGASGGQVQLVFIFHPFFGLFPRLRSAGAAYVTATALPTTGGTGTGMTLNITASVTVSPILGDDDYRVLLKAKIAQNEWDGTIESLYGTWQQLFPGGTIIINDNQDMTADIILAGAFSDATIGMIANGLIVPRPEGVLYNYIFGTLPILGFNRNDTYVAGFDLGHWA